MRRKAVWVPRQRNVLEHPVVSGYGCPGHARARSSSLAPTAGNPPCIKDCTIRCWHKLVSALSDFVA